MDSVVEYVTMTNDPEPSVQPTYLVDKKRLANVSLNDYSFKYAIQIHDRETDEPTVTIDMSGKVTIHQPDKLDEASKQFWEALENMFVANVQLLKRQLA